MSDTYPIHKEPFHVVLLRKGVSELVATPADFKRVAVEAENPLQAQFSDEVEKVEGFRVLMTTKPGVETGPEMLARQRALNGPAIDRSKV